MAHLLSFLNTIPDDIPIFEQILYIQSSLKSLKITVNWDHITLDDQAIYADTNKPMPKKKMIFTSKPNANFDNPIIRESNGVVIEIGSNKIISCPPNNFVPMAIGEVKKNIDYAETSRKAGYKDEVVRIYEELNKLAPKDKRVIALGRKL